MLPKTTRVCWFGKNYQTQNHYHFMGTWGICHLWTRRALCRTAISTRTKWDGFLLFIQQIKVNSEFCFILHGKHSARLRLDSDDVSYVCVLFAHDTDIVQPANEYGTQIKICTCYYIFVLQQLVFLFKSLFVIVVILSIIFVFQSKFIARIRHYYRRSSSSSSVCKFQKKTLSQLFFWFFFLFIKSKPKFYWWNFWFFFFGFFICLVYFFSRFFSLSSFLPAHNGNKRSKKDIAKDQSV